MRFLTYIVFFSYCTGFAQESPYLFQRLSVKDGLFEETVHAVQQDAKGFIWLNFRTLIQRYDGHRLINFYQGVQLPEGNVRAMVIDKKNRLWLLSGDASLGYLNPDNFMYHPVRVNIPKGYNSIITAMYLNRNNEIMLIWDKQGFVTYNDQTKTADQQNNSFVLPKGWEPMHLWQDEALNFWVGSPKGLLKYNSIKKTISYRDHNQDNDPAITTFEKLQNINTVYVDRLKNYWIITWEGGLKILCYNSKKNKQTDWTPKLNAALQKYYVPYGFTETKDNDLWLTGSSIFCRIKTDDESLQVIPQHSSAEYSILYDMVFSVYEDREKNIWLGTNKGLFRFNPNGQFFTAFPNRHAGAQSLETEVTDFLETKDGELLISTWGSGIFSYDKKLNPVSSSNVFYKAAIEGSMAWSMIQRDNGDVWCGMQAGAVYIFEAATKKFYNQSVPLAEGKTIRQLGQDKNGNIWMGTHGGAVIKWDVIKHTYSRILQIDGIISRIFVDKQNRVWIGTDRAGLYRLNSNDGAVQQHYTSSAPLHKKLLINGVADILQYNDSIFYVAGN
ncbi:MAG: hypothetical protein HEQ40_03685 [Lacibacter sp.]